MYKFYYINGYGVTSYIRKSTTSLWQIAWNPNIRKWLMRINLTCLMLLIAFMQVSLAANAQKISLSKKNAPLTEIFKELRKQSGYDFVINKDQIKIAKPVTIVVNGDDLINVLNKCFEDQPFTYSMEDKMIIVVNRKLEQVKVNILPLDVKGRLVDESGIALVGASISIKGSERKTITDDNGEFSFTNVDETAILIISFIGYETKEVPARADLKNIKMVLSTSKLNEVSVVSTGYETLAKERVTGSFEIIDNKMLNRRTGTDILSRLEGITSGLQFDRRGQNPDQTAVNAGNIVIRGISTLSSNIKTPLIVLDNFPYEGDILNINPSDIEQVTVLKDAAAASIWGARAGNGVIVITTKKGTLNSALKITLGTNLIVSEKPDLFAYPIMSSSDFIDVEQYLFRQGFYDSALGNNTTYSVLSPAIEIFDQSRRRLISHADSTVLIDELKGRDVRRDFDKYLYKNGLSQQYNMGINGGSEKMAYSVSAGLDKNLLNLRGNSYQRITLRTQNIYKPIKNIEILFGLQYSSSVSKNNSPGGINDIQYAPGKNLYPYAQLGDASGNAVYFAKNYRSGYLDTAGRGKLLDWKYSPIDELSNGDNNSKLNGILINTGFRYKLSDNWTADLKYQFEQNQVSVNNLYNQKTFLTRDLINQFTLVQGEKLTYRVPLGSILNSSNSTLSVHSARAQVSYNKQWEKHSITGITGFEVRDGTTESSYNRTYGYDENTLSISSVDYITNLTKYGKLGTGRIPFNAGFNQLENRSVSIYANAAYTLKERYILSGSIRRDASNIFGASTNNKWKPLWSSGFAWEISREEFYNIGFLPMLKLRATYGVSGNTNNSISSIPILSYSAGANNIVANLQNATILSGGNPNLTWESVKTFNLGIDFSAIQKRISGSFEWYRKRTDDLIAGQLIDPTTGFGGITSNSGGMLGEGFDFTLNTVNLTGVFSWNTTLIFSRASAKITKILNDVSKRQGLDYAIGDGSLILQAQDTNPYALWAFKWGGLDSKTGNPIGYLNNLPSQDYTAIQNGTLVQDLIYKGTALPPYFGSLRNSFNYKNFGMSFNMTYKFGYYFRKKTISYYNLYNNGASSGDFAKRWTVPGDELKTDIPSMVYPAIPARDSFYQGSEASVLKGDHIRVQDISFSYDINLKKSKSLPANSLSFYLYINNVGILWRANKEGLDPDYNNGNAPFPLTRSISAGLKINL